MKGLKSTSAAALTTTSMLRLSVSFHPCNATSRMVRSGRPPRSLMVTSLAMIWKTSGKTRMPTFSRSHRLMMLTISWWLLSGMPMITSSTL